MESVGVLSVEGASRPALALPRSDTCRDNADGRACLCGNYFLFGHIQYIMLSYCKALQLYLNVEVALISGSLLVSCMT